MMSHEERLEIEIAGNQFLLRYRCEGIADAAEFEHLCENLRALARQWSHQETVRKSLAFLLCGEAIIVRNFDWGLGPDASSEEFRNQLIEVESLSLACFVQTPDADNLALPFE